MSKKIVSERGLQFNLNLYLIHEHFIFFLLDHLQWIIITGKSTMFILVSLFIILQRQPEISSLFDYFTRTKSNRNLFSEKLLPENFFREKNPPGKHPP